MRNSPTAFLIAWLAFCQFCIGAGTWNGVAFTAWNGVAITAWNGTGISVGGGGPTYLVDEGFEGTGYEDSWTETGTGTLDEDYTTIPLVGSQSLKITTSSQTGRVYIEFAAQDEIWVYFKFHKPSNTGAQTGFCQIAQTGGTDIYTFFIAAGQQMRVAGGNTVTTLSDDTDYHVWLHYVKGTGANAVVSCAFSTDGVKPTSGNNFRGITNGALTTQAGRIMLATNATQSVDYIFDRVLVDDAEIGDNP